MRGRPACRLGRRSWESGLWVAAILVISFGALLTQAAPGDAASQSRGSSELQSRRVPLRPAAPGAQITVTLHFTPRHARSLALLASDAGARPRHARWLRARFGPARATTAAADRYLARHGLSVSAEGILTRTYTGSVAAASRGVPNSGAALPAGRRAVPGTGGSPVASAGPGPACQLHRRPQQPRGRPSASRQRGRSGDAEIMRRRIPAPGAGARLPAGPVRLARRLRLPVAARRRPRRPGGRAGPDRVLELHAQQRRCVPGLLRHHRADHRRAGERRHDRSQRCRGGAAGRGGGRNGGPGAEPHLHLHRAERRLDQLRRGDRLDHRGPAGDAHERRVHQLGRL